MSLLRATEPVKTSYKVFWDCWQHSPSCFSIRVRFCCRASTDLSLRLEAVNWTFVALTYGPQLAHSVCHKCFHRRHIKVKTRKLWREPRKMCSMQMSVETLGSELWCEKGTYWLIGKKRRCNVIFALNRYLHLCKRCLRLVRYLISMWWQSWIFSSYYSILSCHMMHQKMLI